MTVKVINKSKYPLPTYATKGSAGFDLRANIDAPITLNPLERYAIPTGIFMELPRGYEAQVRPRSGLALRFGITVLNSPGTIDSDYRGESHALLINLSNKPFTVYPGDRVAQMIVSNYEKISWEEVEVLSETQRGEGGHGSTGIK